MRRRECVSLPGYIVRYDIGTRTLGSYEVVYQFGIKVRYQIRLCGREMCVIRELSRRALHIWDVGSDQGLKAVVSVGKSSALLRRYTMGLRPLLSYIVLRQTFKEACFVTRYPFLPYAHWSCRLHFLPFLL